MRKRTRVNHPPRVELPRDNRALIEPIYQTVKFEFETLEETERFLRGERPGFFYTRASNPTLRQLELLLAELQGREDCLVTGSGVAALSQTLLALTKQGDHILCFVEMYNPTRYIIRRLLGRFGVTHTMLSIEDLPGIERVLASTPTRLVCFESPTNPVTRIADLEAITGMARKAGALTLLDNTFAGFHQHGEYDIDLYAHSLTKYASGTGDVMGGAVIGSAELIRKLKVDFGSIGALLDPHAAFLILRGLKTYFVRYSAQSATAQRIAEFLSAHPAVKHVHYPGLRTHPQHALAAKQMREFGTVVTLDLQGGAEAAGRFANALEFFAKTPSLGSTESLIVARHMMGGREISGEHQRISGITPGTVRLSIGLEDPDDLIEDLAKALTSAGG